MRGDAGHAEVVAHHSPVDAVRDLREQLVHGAVLAEEQVLRHVITHLCLLVRLNSLNEALNRNAILVSG